MSKKDTTAAARQAAHRQRLSAAGIEVVRIKVPSELVEQARRVVNELIEQHKGQK